VVLHLHSFLQLLLRTSTMPELASVSVALDILCQASDSNLLKLSTQIKSVINRLQTLSWNRSITLQSPAVSPALPLRESATQASITSTDTSSTTSQRDVAPAFEIAILGAPLLSKSPANSTNAAQRELEHDTAQRKLEEVAAQKCCALHNR
jgi:hypothetical protein